MAAPKQQRLALTLAAVVALIGAALLAMWGLRDRAAYFYVPADIAAGKAVPNKAMRLGGMVQKGSLRRAADGVTVNFRVTDGPASVPVTFRGILPDLFREGSGVVAEGQMTAAGVFIASNILAKHDERYMPPQMGNIAAEKQTRKTVE
ncbi:cytochrome c maturation protein CcmE [Sphingomonas ginkgonis]|uniref:Cytochrome c-type biogenesis protein CcmE n=1 Tax=Sphingomonas ginkgonis TaxID=2315330 RepID=A0A3R9WQQ3_9SPHN|nr:cytochrome c maturation protein CcmE [Sphingomonas ginkgonis]RST31152.1 cytochrome c maturation protein CcmE [Sphingomonas ginkgonis]